MSRSPSWGPVCAGALCAACGLACGDAVGVPVRLAREAPASSADAGRPDRDATYDEGAPSGFDREYCAPALGWPRELASAEAELLEAINRARGEHIECDGHHYGDLPPLRLAPALQCAARLHARDMAVRGYTRRENPEGRDPGDRMRSAGFPLHDDEWDESIVVGAATPAEALARLLNRRRDCLNLATRELFWVGIGRYGTLWTLDFADD